MEDEDIQIPAYIDLMRPTLEALAELGGEGSNESVDAKVIEVAGVTVKRPGFDDCSDVPRGASIVFLSARLRASRVSVREGSTARSLRAVLGGLRN